MRAVVEAYGNVEAIEVEVAMKYWAVGVVVAPRTPELFAATSELVIPVRVRAPVEEKLEVPVAPK